MPCSLNLLAALEATGKRIVCTIVLLSVYISIFIFVILSSAPCDSPELYTNILQSHFTGTTASQNGPDEHGQNGLQQNTTKQIFLGCTLPLTLETENYHNANSAVTCDTAGRRHDNLWCPQGRKNWRQLSFLSIYSFLFIYLFMYV